MFRRDRERLVADGISDQEIDSHLFAIQDAIRPDPLAEPWSTPLPGETPGTRVAVSDATQAEPNALLVLYRVVDRTIRLWRVRRRVG